MEIHHFTTPKINYSLQLVLDNHFGVEDLEEQSPYVRNWCTTFLWKFLWQLHAAHLRAPWLPSSPAGMNLQHPSTTYFPILAAWFFLQSSYVIILSFIKISLEIFFSSSIRFIFQRVFLSFQRKTRRKIWYSGWMVLELYYLENLVNCSKSGCAQ